MWGFERSRIGSVVAALALATPAIAADGPGIPALHFDASELFQPIGTIDSRNGAPRAHGLSTMHRGWLAVIFSRDGGTGDGGFAFYDVSSPRCPRLVARRDDDETQDIREAHGYGFARVGDRDVVVLQATRGIQFWDWTDVTQTSRLSYLVLPGVTASDYATGAWWAFFQSPFVYVGGSANGIYIVDASDPNHPSLVDRGAGRPNPIPTDETGGFRVGPVFAVGNLLVASSLESAGYATFDVSGPRNPVLLGALTDGAPAVYASLFNGGRMYGAGLNGQLTVTDVTDPSQMFVIGQAPIHGRGGYLTIQDGFAHCGASAVYAKVDVRGTDFDFVGSGSSGIADRDEDFASVIGNLVVVGDDHGNGSVFLPHASEPDLRGPDVNGVEPRDGARDQATTSRIGLTLSDQIDLRSVGRASFVVQPLGGAPLPGRYSGQTGIVNFAPDEPLQPSTVYEVLVPAGGIRDVAGNATETAFRSTFRTGPESAAPLACRLLPTTPAIVGEDALVRAEATGGAGPALFSFDFADGTPATAPSASATATHAWTRPGHFSVRVTVTDGQATHSCARIQTVYVPPTPRAPTSSSSIVWDAALDRVWVANGDAGTVTAIDGASHTKLFEAPVGAGPRSVAISPDGTVWVVCEEDATVVGLSPVDGHVRGSVELPPGSRPRGIAFQSDGALAWVTLEATGRIVSIDPHDGSIVDRIVVGPRPRAIAISADSRGALVTRFTSPEDHGEVSLVSLVDRSVLRTIALARDPGPDGEASGRGVPNYLASVTISPDGSRAWVASKKDDVERGLRRDGQPLTFENTVRAIVSQIDLDAGVERLGARIDLDNRSLPSAVAFSPHGDVAFVATWGSNVVDVFDAYDGALVTSLEHVGLAPSGLALRLGARELFVACDLSRTVAVYDLRRLLGSPRSDAVRLATIDTVATEPLDPVVLRGKQIFNDASDRRMSRDGYLTCASCHFEGDDDGRTWDFTDRGEGLRNTIALVGRGGMREGRVHWTGNFDEIQDFENDVRLAFRGEGFLTDAQFARGTRREPLGDPKAGLSVDLDALAAYVASLATPRTSPFRAADGSLTPQGAAGRDVFGRLRCARCHAGADFTDSATGVAHDVGTNRESSGLRLGRPLLGLDTPTLRGLWETAPYLHDGSAATLDDVLVASNVTGRHGDVASLSENERGALVAYLLQIDALESPEPDSVPAIVVATSARGASVDEGTPIGIGATTVDGDDPITSVEFFVDGELLALVEAPPWLAAWVADGPGDHEIGARALHASGATTTANAVRLSVGASACRAGNVNAAAGAIADVLFVNGSAGAGAERRVALAPSDPVSVTLAAPPSRVGLAAPFALYLWAGNPTALQERVLAGALGATCFPTPVSGGEPAPLFVANNLGARCRLGFESWPGPPTAPAPGTVLALPRGVGRRGQWFLQGFILDSAAPGGRVAITNGVLVSVE